MLPKGCVDVLRNLVTMCILGPLWNVLSSSSYLQLYLCYGTQTYFLTASTVSRKFALRTISSVYVDKSLDAVTEM